MIALTAPLSPILTKNRNAGGTVTVLRQHRQRGHQDAYRITTVNVTSLPIGTDSLTAVYLRQAIPNFCWVNIIRSQQRR